MKVLVFLLSGFLACSIATAAEAGGYRSFVAPDAVQSDLKGRVKVVREKTSELQDGKEDPISESESVYDPEGYLVEERDKNSADAEVEILKPSYDGKGNLVAQEEVSGNKTVAKTVRILPDRKRVVWEIEKNGRKSVVTETTFDRFGKEGEIREFDDRGELSGTYQTKRDAKGREEEVVFRDARGNIETLIKVDWDERDFPVSDEHDARREKFLVRTTYEYPEVDAQGNWTRQIAKKTYFEKGKETLKAQDVTVRTIEYH